MADPGVILWDFDGTLGERPGGWDGLLIEALDAEAPNHAFTAQDFYPLLGSGFPWQEWHVAHPEWTTAEAWWDNLRPVLASAYTRVGLEPDVAAALTEVARQRYPDPSRFVLYDDTLPTLRRLSDRGWRHAILSNHVPELAEIIAQTALADLVNWVISSGTCGFEKPHPEAYTHVRTVIGKPIGWMVGDNPECDVVGARRAGIRALLVRRDDGQTRPFAPDLACAAEIILSEGDHWRA